jgi:CubicO group peptidase (beta-lactamase class C family)
MAVAALAAAILVSGCGGADDPATPEAACEPELADALDAWGDAGFSGSVAIVDAGVPRCLAAYGMADEAAGRANTPETVFSIGSITKAVTAATVLQLVDDGRLALDDRAGDVVPGLAGPVADATIEQLLLHTTGLNGSIGADHEPLSLDDAIARLNELEREHEPGTEFLYSNAGYSLLAIVVEQVSGTSYRDATMRTLELPDGRVAGGFWDGEPAAPGPRAVGYLDGGEPSAVLGDFAGPHWTVDGNGSVAMTVGDLAAWTRALFTGEVLSAASTAAVAELGFAYDDGVLVTPGWARYDAELLGEVVFTSAGGGGDLGHNAVVVWLPESDRVVAAASNTDGVSAEELLDVLVPALVADDPIPRPEVDPIEVDPAELEAAVGTYAVDGDGTLTVTAVDGGLDVAALDGPGLTALVPRPDGADGHEARVEDVLAGTTAAGRQEVEALESDLGPLESTTIVGTIERDGELRTYVTVTAGGEALLGWYSVDDAGGIQAVELPTAVPTLRFVPVASGRFRPDDPTGQGPDVTIERDDDELRITTAGTTTVASRTP